MPSVIATWNGQLTDRVARKNLCDHLLQLAEISHGYYETPEPVRQYDRVIEGNILVGSNLLNQESANSLLLLEEASAAPSPGGIQLRPAGPQYGPKPMGDDVYAIEHAVIHGIDFCLYDGRNLYPGEDHISFVFIEAEACPELSGSIVQVEDHQQCAGYRSELIQGADWFIQRPQIHLRGYCEEWLDMLMSWVKYFYIPSLGYWRWEDLPNWQVLSRMFDENRSANISQDQYSSLVFDSLVAAFTKNVEESREMADSVRAFWTNVGKINKQQKES